MYHLNKDIQILDGINKLNVSFHYLSKYEIDFVNNTTSVQISSCIDKQDWINNNFYSKYVNFFQVKEIPTFTEDPSSFILKKLITLEGTIFYDSEIVRDYEIETYDRELLKQIYGVTQ